MSHPLLKKRMRRMLIGITLLLGGIFLYKGCMKLMFGYYMSHMKQIITVSTTTVQKAPWPQTEEAVATLRAVAGVDVTTELAGMVQTIYFKPGQTVEAGDILVQLKANSDIATLNALQANTALANITLIRDTAQFAAHAVSQATLDKDTATLKNLQAQTAAQAATVYKKTILAPFSGRLGISAINVGQYLSPGNKIVTLQQLNPVYADFYVPQQTLAQLKTGQTVKLSVDTFPGKIFEGKITTINPVVDNNTRNIQVEATLSNPGDALLPGMFAKATVILGKPKMYLTLPASAISFNPYGSVVYLLNRNLTVTQVFVTTGEEKGDRVAILQGIQEGDEVVTSGQLKLKNGVHVTVNNNTPMPDSATPPVNDEH